MAKVEECKAFIDSTGTKSANLEDKSLRLSVLPRWRERPQTTMCCREWFGT